MRVQPVQAHVPCAHCGEQRTKERIRRLCRRCHSEPEIRARYAPIRDTSASDLLRPRSHFPDPAEPSAAPPGSFEKLQVMHDRARRGEKIFHPQDLQLSTPLTEADALFLLGLLELLLEPLQRKGT